MMYSLSRTLQIPHWTQPKPQYLRNYVVDVLVRMLQMDGVQNDEIIPHEPTQLNVK